MRLVPASDGRLKIGIRVVSRIELLLLNKYELVDTIDLTDNVDCRRATEGEVHMNKMEKFLENKGIIYEADEFEMMKGPEYDWCRKLVDITDQFIITVMYSAVLDPEIHIFDRHTFEMVAQQNLYPDPYGLFGERNKWGSYMNFE